MEAYLLPLDGLEPEQRMLVGGKALHLGELCRAGVRVPRGFCLTTAAYRLFLHQAGLEPRLEAALSELEGEDREGRLILLREEMQGHPLPLMVSQVIAEAHGALGERAVAVRSSATGEDLPEASFAGQYDSYLNICGLEETEEKVKACWASLWNSRALHYLQRHHISPLEVTVGVVLQEQLPARVSGVLFTLNPSTGREEEMLVEAHWGLGEAVASGKVTPDRFVLDAWKEKVLSREISEKRMMVVPAQPSGVQEVELPQDMRQQPTLTDEQLLTLLQLGFRIQEIYGYPQDIEWALHQGEFYVLQTRPLTSYTFDPDMGQWSSANFREVMPGFITPLSFSMNGQYEWGKSLEEIFQRTKMMRERREVEWGRLFFGRAYWNVGEVKGIASIVPGFKERAFDQSAGVEPTYEGDGLVTPTTPATILRALPILFALNGLFETFWKEAREYKEAFMEGEVERSQIDPAALSDEELAEKVKAFIELHYRTNRIALIISFLATQAQDDFTPLVEALNARNPEVEPISMARLLTGLTGVSTGRPMAELWKVSREALKSEKVTQVILETEPNALPEKLNSFPEGRAFWETFQGYIQEFRYLSEKDEDMSAPRWDEDPSFALATLKSFIQGGGDGDPEELIAQQTEVRLREEERAAALLNRGWLDRLLPFRKRPFFSKLERLKRYSWWREGTRPMLSLAHYHCHRIFVEQGKRWARAGYLEGPEDIFFLLREQVLATLEGRLSSQEARERVRKYKRMKACYRHFEPPPIIGRGSRPPEHISPAQQSFRGVACSSGQATARAKVVRGLGEASKLLKGEILVAPHINPGWVPLFSLAAAIVTEEGGLISHGAIVAREYGIPTVLQVREATKIFRDGQVLRVDGDRGVVEVIG